MSSKDNTGSYNQTVLAHFIPVTSQTRKNNSIKPFQSILSLKQKRPQAILSSHFLTKKDIMLMYFPPLHFWLKKAFRSTYLQLLKKHHANIFTITSFLIKKIVLSLKTILWIENYDFHNVKNDYIAIIIINNSINYSSAQQIYE